MNAGASFFVDTNVFLYRFDSVAPEKQRRADLWISALWEGRSAGRISWQVIFEFYSNLAKKTGASQATAKKAVEGLLLWNPEPPTHAMLQRAWHWCDEAHINFWDALIVAAAEQAGCRWLLSEDFQSGRKFGQVTVVNPLFSQPSEFQLS